MDKQEVIQRLGWLRYAEIDDEKYKFYNKAIDSATSLASQLDEPEKPVLTKAEAEWVDNLTNFFSLSDALYRITRCGYGYLFTFEMGNKVYDLPFDGYMYHDEFDMYKERLVNAVLYGYTTKEEETLYEVFLLKTGVQIGAYTPDGEEKSQFTREELKEYGFTNLDGYRIDEVKND